MHRKLRQLVIGLVATLMLSVLFVSNASAQSYIRAYADDTMAGLGTTISANNLASLSRVIFDLKTPSGNVYSFPTFTDENGYANLSIKGDELVKAGKYYVALKNSTAKMAGPSTSFTVYPDSVHRENSQVRIDNARVAADNKEQANIQVLLRDQYGNPIPYHEIQLISKREADTFVMQGRNNFTDESGSVSFGVRSAKAGSSEIFVYDLSDQKFIGSPISIDFVSKRLSDVGGPFDNYYLDDPFETLAFGEKQFVFPNFPLEVEVAEPFSFTLEVRDSENEIVQDYQGTVHFSVPDAEIGDVVLPDDYEFTIDDQGTHTFPLSLQFQKEGTYKLYVQDVDDNEMILEQNVVVGSGTSTSLFKDAGIEITQPSAGTYGNTSQVIQGKAGPGLIIKIYDNDKEIASTNTDIQGNFSYTTGALIEGEHVVYAVSISSEGEILDVSDDLIFRIDTSAPVIREVNLDPESGANPGEFVNIEIEASEELDQVIAQFEKENIELIPVEGKTNTYGGVLQAPNEFGTYHVDVVLVDELGNQSISENVTFVVVGNGEKADDSEKQEAFVSNVARIEAYPSDSRVTLLWEEAKSIFPVKHYRIYYGESADLLNHIVDTHDDANTWYIPKLQNGTEYFFAVTAVDDKGNESAKFSPVVASRPFATQPKVEPFVPFVEEQAAKRTVEPLIVAESPRMQGNTGPEILYLLVFSGFAGTLLFKRRK